MKKYLKVFDEPPFEEPHCVGCGEYFSKKKLKAKELCRSCYSGWMRQRTKWKNRGEYIFVSDKKTRLHKQIVKKMYGDFPFCNWCGAREWGYRKHKYSDEIYQCCFLHIHHIDEDKNNNSPSNLIPLCASCHKNHHVKEKMMKQRQVPKVDK